MVLYHPCMDISFPDICSFFRRSIAVAYSEKIKSPKHMDAGDILSMLLIDDRWKDWIHISFLTSNKATEKLRRINRNRAFSKYPLLNILFKEIDRSSGHLLILLTYLGKLTNCRKLSIKSCAMLGYGDLEHLPLSQGDM